MKPIEEYQQMLKAKGILILVLLTIITLLLACCTCKAQIRPIIINKQVCYYTELNDIVFLKCNNKYFVSLECDGGKDTTIKSIEIKFDNTTYKDTLTKININTTKYVVTYNYTTLIELNPTLLDLFLNNKVLSYKIGSGFKVINSNKYKKILIKLINYEL